MRKKKQLRLLIILLLLLALSVFGYIMAARSAKEDDAEETEEAEDTIALYPSDFDVENLASLSYQVNGKTLTFVQQDGTWYYKKDKSFPVDQSSLTGMDSELLDLAATRKVTDNLENASEYGLSTPSNQITLKDTSGNSFTIYVGDDNEGAGITYVYTSEDEAVFTVDSEFATYFTNSLLTVMSMEELPVPNGTETFKTISIKSGTGKLSVRQLSSIDYSTDYLGVMGYRADDTRSGSDETYGVEGDLLEDFSAALQEISPTACVSYKAGKSQLKKYGLDSPAYTLKLDYTQQEAIEDDSDEEDSDSEETESDEETEYETVPYHETFYIGVKEGDSLTTADYYYVTWDGTENIYQTDAASWEGILDLEKTDLTCMTPLAFNEDELMKLEITHQGSTFTYENSILSEDSESEEETDSQDETDETDEASDAEDTDDAFENIRSTLESIRAEDFYPSDEKAPETDEDTLVIKVTLDRKKRNGLTITLTPYDGNYYALMVDGDPLYLINKTDVAGLINDLK